MAIRRFLPALLLAIATPAFAQSPLSLEGAVLRQLQSMQPIPRPAYLATRPTPEFVFGRDLLVPHEPLPADASRAAVALADARLNALGPLFAWPAPAVPEALHATPADECAFELGSTALRYRADPNAHRDRFFALLAIDDYEARAAKRLDVLGRDDLMRSAEAVFASRPGVEDTVLRELTAFCSLRRKDLWFVHDEEGLKSFARAVRVKMVQNLLAGTDEVGDVPGMLRMIDANVDMGHLSKPAPERRRSRRNRKPRWLRASRRSARAFRIRSRRCPSSCSRRPAIIAPRSCSPPP
jgi:hypothetical protein